MLELSRRAALASLFAGGGVIRAPGLFDSPVEPTGDPGFSLVRITPNSGIGLRLMRPALRGAATLRVAIARDERVMRLLRVRLARSGREIGAFDIRYACVFEPFDLPLDAETVQAAQDEGLRLELEGGETPLFLLAPTTANARGLAPQLWQARHSRPEDEFIARLSSLDSLQQLSWMEGCVLEGLRDLGLDGAWRAHLEFFFNEPARIDSMFGVENTLPAAALARWKPEHPAVARTIAFWRKSLRSDQTIGGGDSTVAECNYTVAYPMTVAARVVEDEWLAQQALRQLRAARDRLSHGGALWLRYYAGGKRTYPNWCRGVCWYSLGLARTLIAMPRQPPADDLKQELRRVLDFARGFQREDGLYSCFLDERTIAPDTGGSAGIAAAMALAARHGLVGGQFRESARATWNGLVRKLTADGFLTGVSQSNKREAGEALQRSGYRVTLQFGMGLMAQLKAALEGPAKPV
jgi:hypothetical protein